jgi:NhaP-type Na+/H+ or K+/H+ antiporter
MELTFISYAGMIRGAIAFALVLTLPVIDPETKLCSDPTLDSGTGCFHQNTYDMLVSTTLVLVILTTLCFGTFMSIVQKFLVSPSEEDLKEVERDMRSKSIA